MGVGGGGDGGHPSSLLAGNLPAIDQAFFFPSFFSSESRGKLSLSSFPRLSLEKKAPDCRLNKRVQW